MTALRPFPRRTGLRFAATVAASLVAAALGAPAFAQTAATQPATTTGTTTTGAMSMAQTMTVADTAAALAAQANAARANTAGTTPGAQSAATPVQTAPDSVPVMPESLPAPATTIFPGDLITDEMIIDSGLPSGLGEYAAVVRNRSQVVGKVARRTLPTGKVIPLNALQDPKLVSRGVAVEAVFEEGGLNITTLVMPLQDGSVGSLIQARNVDSGKVISGIVAADGTLRVGGMGGS